MKNIIKILSCLLILSGMIYSCEDYYHDSGISDGYHDCSILDYMKRDCSGNWDSTLVLIYHANLENLYDGSNPDYEEITFFAPTSLSIIMTLLKTVDAKGNRVYYEVKDIPVELCKEMLLSHTLIGKKKMQDFEYEVKGTLTGGSELPNLLGDSLRIYRTKTDFNGISDIGPEQLYIQSKQTQAIGLIGSSNIECINGYVHAMAYTYRFMKL